jgi:hypothetical protein
MRALESPTHPDLSINLHQAASASCTTARTRSQVRAIVTAAFPGLWSGGQMAHAASAIWTIGTKP